MSFTVLNIDTLKYAKKLKQNNVLLDAIITDPPYNISKKNNFQTIGRKGIDFGNWDYGFNQTKWISVISPFLKPGGTIIIFNDYKNFGQITKTLEKNGFEIKDLIRWIKNNPMPRNLNRRYVTDYEFAIWAIKSNGKWVFNKPKQKSYLRPEYKTSIVSAGKNKIHPTQKSTELISEIIKVHTNEGDLIFDPFMGSGSTGIAAIKNNRCFLGCEINKEYFKNSKTLLISNLKKLISKNKSIIRSPLYYLGDKYKLLSQIYSLFPKEEINTFYDVFGGGGTMLANIIANRYVYNDKNIYLLNLLKTIYTNNGNKIINSIQNLINKFNIVQGNKGNTLKNKEKYEKLKYIYNNENLDFYTRNIYLFTLVIFGFNSQIRFNSKSEFNIPIGKQHFNKDRILNLKKFNNCIRTKDIDFLNLDFEFIYQLIENKEIKNNDFFYFDPPLFNNFSYI